MSYHCRYKLKSNFLSPLALTFVREGGLDPDRGAKLHGLVRKNASVW